MGKYIPKCPRGQCEHIYGSGSRGKTKGERCSGYGRLGKDGHFMCRKHGGGYYELLKKRNVMRRDSKIKRLVGQLKKLTEGDERTIAVLCMNIEAPLQPQF